MFGDHIEIIIKKKEEEENRKQTKISA